MKIKKALWLLLPGVAVAAPLALLLLSPVGGGSSAHAGGPCDPLAPVPILDDSTATLDCVLTDPGGIKDLNAGLVINHTYTGDLNISLTHQDTGTSASLIFKKCGSDDDISALLDDEASDPVGSTCPIFGTFRPESPLSVFDGESLAGTWTLRVSDQVGPDEGSIKGFQLIANTNHGIGKDPKLANLWLCNQAGDGCLVDKESGVEALNFDVNLNDRIVGFAKGEAQALGAFEFEVRYEAKYVNVDVTAGTLFAREDVDCLSVHRGDGAVNFRCITKGKPEDAPVGPGTLAVVHVTPTADVYSLLIANQGNPIVTQLINLNCHLSDLQGHPVVLESGSDVCENAAVTIRYLEGDIRADCVVDVLDQQQIAFRWGANLGNLLYNSSMDLEPSQPIAGDGDIDGKDLQFVYGRHGSTCKAPHPAQLPVDPGAKE